jgi:hypothetical protein
MDRIAVLLASVLLSVAGVVLAQTDDADRLSPEAEREARRAISVLRAPNASVDQQVAAVEKLVALGPAGASRLQTTWTEELDRLAEAAGSLTGESELDQQIARLRNGMAELRARDDLTKEMIQQFGDPAIEQLSRLATLKGREEATAARSRERLQARLAKLTGLFDALATQTAERPDRFAMLDLSSPQARIEELSASLEPDPSFAEAREIQAKNQMVAVGLDPKNLEGMQMLNELRILLGLKPLLFDAQLVQASQMHSADMKSNNFFDHESPVPGRKTFMDRAKIAGTTASGENIYMGSQSPKNAILGWFHSPGHHKNMFGDHARQGLGHSAEYWTHLFGR